MEFFPADLSPLRSPIRKIDMGDAPEEPAREGFDLI
jgi:hypothetical protein